MSCRWEWAKQQCMGFPCCVLSCGPLGASICVLMWPSQLFSLIVGNSKQLQYTICTQNKWGGEEKQTKRSLREKWQRWERLLTRKAGRRRVCVGGGGTDNDIWTKNKLHKQKKGGRDGLKEEERGRRRQNQRGCLLLIPPLPSLDNVWRN